MRLLLDTHALLGWISDGDPFDRMLASQALLDDLTLVSGDRVFTGYPVATEW